MSWMDFNTAEKSTTDLIPNKTPVKVHMKIRPGGYDDPAKGWTGGYATRKEETGAIYLDAEFTVMGGKYNKRKVWTLIGLHSPKGPKWEAMGREFIRAALESARGIRPDDVSEQAMKARQISGIADIDGLEFVAMVEVEAGQAGYDDKNKIQKAIPVTHKDYAALMQGQGAPAGATGTLAQAAKAQAPASSKPAWAD